MPRTDALSDLLLGLLDPDVRETWGWRGPLRPRSGRSWRPLRPGDRCALLAGGLAIPYFVGHVTVDVDARTVEFAGVDQKTPADERWMVAPDDGWWDRALALDWPVGRPRG